MNEPTPTDASESAANPRDGSAETPPPRRSRIFPTRRRAIGWLLVIAIPVVLFVTWIESMPNRTGTLETVEAPPEFEAHLQSHVRMLSEEIGPRSIKYGHHEALERAAGWIRSQWEGFGYTVEEQEFEVFSRPTRNLWVTLPGSDPDLPILVLGAHYDSEGESRTPGADDNASGVAILLELTRALRDFRPRRSIRFVAFTTEEPPHFQNTFMGSLRYARMLAEAEVPVELMISLESLGYYSEEEGSQGYPALLRASYPSVGNFVGVVGRFQGRSAVTRVADLLGRHCDLPFESAALADFLPGVGWSDHWSFWQHDYEAVMLTDTAVFRNPNYHKPGDTWDTLDYRVMAALTEALVPVVRELSE